MKAAKKSPRPAAARGRFGWVKWVFIVPVVLVLVVQLYFFLQIWWWVDHNPSMTSFMREQESALQDKNPKAEIRQTWVPYNRISNNLKRAIIASEDANFSEHEGVDWEALQKAYEKNNKKRKVVAGGSTITQQLAKNLFLSGSRSYVRKGQELVITYMLETLMDKRRIFEIYLNVVEFGTGTFGAEAASRHYYRTSAANLSAGQAARLAVMLPNPRYYDAHRDTNYLNRRTATILARMNSAELP
ncbi:monofunctional biosynthetic peptidoglycan transglycosylase [Duganella sp. Leaf61]|jgi:monofunctional biosynthetic peptidoglycan transglycosylase|uniref:monofunctional biosynthetic peptidoglycan transglycosylase n=1 Tax=Duganella sp. Leaf61 TaxID=1736227 RepID=UPI0006F8CCC5|nr:monofunctional biosynthetic peptidoglycan transglycosylase [Duganella sp. Leaf61]KQN79323.1 monofunctional biosynthetic peptidoglycan transglycosylase [Duganella sp. Leaf61]